MSRTLRTLLVAAVVALSSTLALAQTQLATFQGDTTGDPTFQRPTTVGDGTSGSCFTTAAGSAIRYEVITFTTDTSGQYVIDILAPDPIFDTYLLLYEGSFDPTDQCQNLIALDDDNASTNNSTIGAGSYSGRDPLVLTAGTEYNVVVTGFSDTNFGVYNGTISGPSGATITFGGAPTCTVDFSATANTTSVPGTGGTIIFNVSATNNGAGTAALVLTLNATGPITYSRNLGQGSLPAGGSINRAIPVRVPGAAPNGIYNVTLDLQADGQPCDSESFIVTKGPAPRVAETGVKVDEAASPVYFPLEVLMDAPLFAQATAAPVGAVVASPNPFASRTSLSFTLAEATNVRLAVYDVLGREVAVLVSGRVEAGQHTAVFDAGALAAGAYVYRLSVDGRVESGRITVVR
jgi:hypothetical protein